MLGVAKKVLRRCQVGTKEAKKEQRRCQRGTTEVSRRNLPSVARSSPLVAASKTFSRGQQVAKPHATIGDYDNVCMEPFHKFKNITKRSNNLLSTRWFDVGNKLLREYNTCLSPLYDGSVMFTYFQVWVQEKQL